MSDIIEDLAVTGDLVTCSRCGRPLADGEQCTLAGDNQVVCPDCEDEVQMIWEGVRRET